MNWCTVDHSTGVTSIDFDREIERIFAQTSPEKEASSRSASTASFDTESSSSASVESRPPPIDTTRQRRCRTVYTCLTDLIILKCVDMFGPRWRFIARHLSNGWTDDMVRNRFTRINRAAQGPITPRNQPSKTHASHRSWSAEEDNKLLMKFEECRDQGRVSWDKLQKTFNQTRSKNAIRNRAHRLGATKNELVCSSVTTVFLERAI